MISILRGINISNVTKLKTKDIHQASTVVILRLLLSLPIFSNFSFQRNKRKKRGCSLPHSAFSLASPYSPISPSKKIKGKKEGCTLPHSAFSLGSPYSPISSSRKIKGKKQRLHSSSLRLLKLRRILSAKLSIFTAAFLQGKSGRSGTASQVRHGR